MSEGKWWWVQPLGILFAVFGIGALILGYMVWGDNEELKNEEGGEVERFVHSEFGELDEDFSWYLSIIESKYVLDLTKATLSLDVKWSETEDEILGKMFFTTFKGMELRFSMSSLLDYKVDDKWEPVPYKYSDIYALRSLLYKDDKKEKMRRFEEHLKKQENKN